MYDNTEQEISFCAEGQATKRLQICNGDSDMLNCCLLYTSHYIIMIMIKCTYYHWILLLRKTIGTFYVVSTKTDFNINEELNIKRTYIKNNADNFSHGSLSPIFKSLRKQ